MVSVDYSTPNISAPVRSSIEYHAAKRNHCILFDPSKFLRCSKAYESGLLTATKFWYQRAPHGRQHWLIILETIGVVNEIYVIIERVSPFYEHHLIPGVGILIFLYRLPAEDVVHRAFPLSDSTLSAHMRFSEFVKGTKVRLTPQ